MLILFNSLQNLYIIYFLVLVLFALLFPHLSTCGLQGLWPGPAMWLDQSHLSLQPACCRGKDKWTLHGDENLGDQIWKREVRFKRKDQGRTSTSFLLSVSIGHNRCLMHLCWDIAICTWFLGALQALPWASVSEESPLHSCSCSNLAIHWEEDGG